MTDKILVVGNSHVGAFRSAFIESEEFFRSKNLEFDFLACQQYQDRFTSLHLCHGSIISAPPHVIEIAQKTSTVTMPVDINDYDLILIVAGPCLLHPYLFCSPDCKSIPVLGNALIECILLNSENIPTSVPEVNCPVLVKQLRCLGKENIVKNSSNLL